MLLLNLGAEAEEPPARRHSLCKGPGAAHKVGEADESLTGQCARGLVSFGECFANRGQGRNIPPQNSQVTSGGCRDSTGSGRGSVDWAWVRLGMTSTEEDPVPRGVSCA